MQHFKHFNIATMEIQTSPKNCNSFMPFNFDKTNRKKRKHTNAFDSGIQSDLFGKTTIYTRWQRQKTTTAKCSSVELKFTQKGWTEHNFHRLFYVKSLWFVNLIEFSKKQNSSEMKKEALYSSPNSHSHVHTHTHTWMWKNDLNEWQKKRRLMKKK